MVPVIGVNFCGIIKMLFVRAWRLSWYQKYLAGGYELAPGCPSQAQKDDGIYAISFQELIFNIMICKPVAQ